jgi:hypothetical protein
MVMEGIFNKYEGVEKVQGEVKEAELRVSEPCLVTVHRAGLVSALTAGFYMARHDRQTNLYHPPFHLVYWLSPDAIFTTQALQRGSDHSRSRQELDPIPAAFALPL